MRLTRKATDAATVMTLLFLAALVVPYGLAVPLNSLVLTLAATAATWLGALVISRTTDRRRPATNGWFRRPPA